MIIKKLDPRLRGDDKPASMPLPRINVTPAEAGGKRPEGDSGLEYFT